MVLDPVKVVDHMVLDPVKVVDHMGLDPVNCPAKIYCASVFPKKWQLFKVGGGGLTHPIPPLSFLP